MTTTTEIELSREQRKVCRQHAGLRRYDHPPVEIIEGDHPPKIVGESYHWETKTGIPIYHPTAYAKKGWSSLVYVSSDRRVEVGTEWLAKNLS